MKYEEFDTLSDKNFILFSSPIAWEDRWMDYKRTTPIPNRLFDEYLPYLTLAELRLLLVILRQTNGWHDKRTGKRKARDRINHGQFQKKTGFSRRVISKAIASLVAIGLVEVTDFKGTILLSPGERSGKHRLWYRAKLDVPMHKNIPTYARTSAGPVHESAQNKTKREKLTTLKTKRNEISIQGHIEAIRKQLGM